jgi:hypothetical protein
VLQLFSDVVIEPLDPVVSLLVVAVYGALYFGDFAIAGNGATGDIFLVPEQEVPAMLFADNSECPFQAIDHWPDVPAINHIRLEGDHLFDVDHERSS